MTHISPDGMRRLLAMEKTSGIWTQKMLMRLERKMVNIMDHENKEVVERFPAHFVREPTAFTSNDPKVRPLHHRAEVTVKKVDMPQYSNASRSET